MRRAPVSTATAWAEARAMLLAGMTVIAVARELELPTGRVSDLHFRLQQERQATTPDSRSRSA